jgi:DNA polymerase III alpha subunit
MYIDSKNDRVLLKDGRSVINSFQAAKRIISDKTLVGVSVLSDEHLEKYKIRYGSDDVLSFDETIDDTIMVQDVLHTEEDLLMIEESIIKSKRFDDRNPEHVNRIIQEMEYFVETNNIVFITKLITLINDFKSRNVVWGVGRGSACSSFLLYVLDIHDVNPIKYDIPFSEMSKQVTSKYD